MVFGEERRGEEEEASSWAWQNQLDGRGGGGEKVSVKAPKTLFLQAHAASQERRGGGKIAYLSPDSPTKWAEY